MRLRIVLLLLPLMICHFASAQTDSTQEEKVSKFDEFNKKAENFFKYAPVPLYSFSTEAGHIVGLAKFNLIRLDKRDTISQASKISELFTISTKGRIKAAVTTDFIWNENKWMVLGHIYYKDQNEYIFGIGNNVKAKNAEQFSYQEFSFVNTMYRRTVGNLYVGLGFDIANYVSIEYDSTGFLGSNDILGTSPGANFGFSLGAFIDERDNRYNPRTGYFVSAQTTRYFFDLNYDLPYSRTTIDARKYFNPYKKHVIALQATTTFCTGNVPFYDLALMGGDSQMRGWYTGALRDKALLDGQLEYRMPIWKIFGIVGWVGTGRVASAFDQMAIDGFWLSYGFGGRIMVDSENETNLRFDWGFGNNNVHQFYISFAEAF